MGISRLIASNEKRHEWSDRIRKLAKKEEA